jgi:Holliday junction resolvasome RuvABC endonuclease subunit
MAQREKQGLVRAACQALQVRLVDYQPQTIKAAVGAGGRGSKEQVSRCARALVAVEWSVEQMTEHAWDAVSTALVALNRERARRRLAGATRRQ